MTQKCILKKAEELFLIEGGCVFKNEKEKSEVELNLLYGLQAWGLQTFPLSRCAPGFSVLLRVEFHAPSSTHRAGDTLLLQLPTKQLDDYVMFSMAIVTSLLPYVGGSHRCGLTETSQAAQILEQASLSVSGVGYQLVNAILLSRAQKQNLRCL